MDAKSRALRKEFEQLLECLKTARSGERVRVPDFTQDRAVPGNTEEQGCSVQVER